MKAVAVFPGRAGSIHLAELPEPKADDVPEGRGVLVEVLRVGVDGTDKEIGDAEYGAAPEGYDFLVIGHESFGRVLEVGPNVRDLERSVQDMALAQVKYSGWLERLLTHPVQGLDEYGEMLRLLTEEKRAIKVFVEVNEFIETAPAMSRHRQNTIGAGRGRRRMGVAK